MTILLTFWRLLTGNPIARALGIAIIAVLGVLTFGKVKRREGVKVGRKEERAEAKKRDTEHAQDIRDRVATDRPERVQSVKDRGYRD